MMWPTLAGSLSVMVDCNVRMSLSRMAVAPSTWSLSSIGRGGSSIKQRRQQHQAEAAAASGADGRIEFHLWIVEKGSFLLHERAENLRGRGGNRA
jgi:hypothetical protein